jgi:hypothetical protein
VISEPVVAASEPLISEPGVPASEPVISEPGVAASEPLISEPVVAASEPAEPQASVDIAVAFVVLVPVSVVVVEVDSSGCPKFLVFPNDCSFPNCSSSVEVVG